MKFEASFNPGREVRNPDRLFGREEDLQYLENSLRSGTHTEVVGERKFGKSSLLRCLVNSLGSERGTIVVYVPVNSMDCSQWQDFYGWLTAHITVAFAKKRSEVLEEIGGKLGHKFEGDIGVADIFYARKPVAASGWLGTFYGLFDVVDQCRIPVILILDEISSAIRVFNGDPQKFHYLRELAMHVSSKGDFKPLTVCIADRCEWQEVVPDVGTSPGLNFISNKIRLAGISYENSVSLLRTHGSLCNPPCDPPGEWVQPLLQIAGPYPYYLKVVAEKQYLYSRTNGSLDVQVLEEAAYSAVRGHLVKYINSCDTGEKELLHRLVHSPASCMEHGVALRRLVSRGLLVAEDGFWKPFSRLFKMACHDFFGEWR